MFPNRSRSKADGIESKHKMTIKTDYGSLEVVNLKKVWVKEILGMYKLMYEDAKYEYCCIYWSDSSSSVKRYEDYKRKIIEAYNRGDKIVEIL